MAQQVFDPVEYVGWIVGLGHIGGSSFAKPLQNVGGGSERRQHEHRYVPQPGISLENPAEFVPAHSRHLDVGDDEHRLMFADQGQGLAAIRPPVDRVAGRLQGALQDPPLEAAIFSDHDRQRCIHNTLKIATRAVSGDPDCDTSRVARHPSPGWGVVAGGFPHNGRILAEERQQPLLVERLDHEIKGRRGRGIPEAWPAGQRR